MLKVAHIITSLDDGGAEGIVFRLCSNNSKYQHIVISLSDMGKYGSMLLKKGIKVHALNMKSNRPSLFAFFALIKFLRILKPDLVQTWMYHADLFGGLAARFAGIKTIYWNIRHSAADVHKLKMITFLIVKILAKISCWLPSKIVVCARNDIDKYIALGYDHTKICFIPNGCDLSYFKPRLKDAAILRSNLGFSSETPLIGMVARYVQEKDHDNLLHALAILKFRKIAFCCILLGNKININNAQLIKLIKDLELKDNIVLLHQQYKIPLILSALDIHILSSCSEAFPNIVAESMACETPCVVTDVGDTAHIIGNTGWIVPPKDAQALANGIEHALLEQKNPTKWLRRKKNARNHIEQNFSLEKMIANYNILWDMSRAKI